MFLFLCLRINPTNEYYSLIPPHKTENYDEIGNWTMVGHTANMGNKIRLTHNLTKQSGKICSRIPFVFNEWSLEFNISATGEVGGGKLIVLYSKQCCQDPSYPMDGWAIYIDLKPDYSLESDIYLMFFKNQTFKEAYKHHIGRVQIRNAKTTAYFSISKRYDSMDIDIFVNDHFNRLYSDVTNDTVAYGYLSFYGTTDNEPEQIDVHQVRVWPADDHFLARADRENFTNFNRKRVDKIFISRRKLKSKRRALMPLMQKLTKEAQDMNCNLSFAERKNLTDAFLIVNEAIKRSQDSIRMKALEQFIALSIAPSLENSIKKIEFAKSELNEIKSNVELLYTNLTSTLSTMIFNSKNDLMYINAQILVAAKDLDLSSVRNETIVEDNHVIRDTVVSFVLMLISVVEFVAYIIFFISKRKYIQRKYD